MAEERQSATTISEGAPIDVKYITSGGEGNTPKPHYEVTGKRSQMQTTFKEEVK